MTSTDTLQAWLALEHEAVWLYPVIGARVEPLGDRARTSFSAHRATRDQLLARLSSLGATPVTAALSYDVGPITTSGQARRAARRVERDVAATCLTLVGETEGDARTYAVKGLERAALAELRWAGKPQAFPGLS